MPEKKMILNMLSESKINKEEALKLLDALGEEQELEYESQKTVQDLEEFIEASDKLNPESRQEIEEIERIVEQSKNFDKGLNWVHIDSFAGNIEVRVDESISEPVLIDAEKYKIKEKNGDFYIFHKNSKKNTDKSSSIIDEIGKFVNNLGNDLGGDLDLKVPTGYGLRIVTKAGNIEVGDVPFVYIRSFAGNVELKNIGGLDLDSKAGDIEVVMLANDYKNKIKASAGNVDVRLKQGSSVNLKAKVGVGNMSHNLSKDLKDFSYKEGLTNAKLVATVGDGSANLEIKLGAGNLDLVIEND